jgi:hypothetical protein
LVFYKIIVYYIYYEISKLLQNQQEDF